MATGGLERLDRIGRAILAKYRAAAAIGTNIGANARIDIGGIKRTAPILGGVRRRLDVDELDKLADVAEHGRAGVAIEPRSYCLGGKAEVDENFLQLQLLQLG